MQKLITLLAICILLAACAGQEGPAARAAGAVDTPAPTQTPYPTHTPFPTLTPYPTYTPYPTATRVPPAPTFTAAPTFARTSTSTPVPATTAATAFSLQPSDTATPVHTRAPTATTGVLPAGDVRIVYIFFDGDEGRTEPDEYCEIRNVGESVSDLEGWRLNAGAPGQDFRFPAFDLAPGQAIRVYTNQVHAEYGGFSFAHTETALWANKGDCGYLYDAGGEEVSRYCY
jgi:hypothetical protein